MECPKRFGPTQECRESGVIIGVRGQIQGKLGKSGDLFKPRRFVGIKINSRLCFSKRVLVKCDYVEDK